MYKDGKSLKIFDTRNSEFYCSICHTFKEEVCNGQEFRKKKILAKCDGACLQPQHLGSTGCWISVSFNPAHVDSESQDSQGYIQRLCLNKKILRKKKKNIDLNTPVFALKPFDLI